MSLPPPSQQPPPAPPAEDAANESGSAIDTFSGYVPTALPLKFLQKLKDEKDGQASTSNADHHHHKPKDDKPDTPQVIDLLESDTDEPMDDEVTDKDKKHVGTTSDAQIVSFSDLGLPSHTSPACESALLSSVTAPRPSFDTVQMIQNCALSPLQFEGVALAIQKHSRLFRTSTSSTTSSAKWKRAGFFLGDAAGIGKGRQMAAIVRDSLFRGRKRHLWISVSRELALDAKRDLDAIGCKGVSVLEAEDILLKNINNNHASSKGLGGSSSSSKGVLFITYSLLVSGKRMEQIIQWLTTGKCGGQQQHPPSSQVETSFDGVLIFDEAHKAKNLEADTTTAKLVINLQDRLSNARVVYGSATGVSDLQHMVYANRLGLWGSSLYPDFSSFQQTLSHRGMGSLELLALELKQMGAFVARSLSWDGAEFHTMITTLSENEIYMYNEAVAWWVLLQQEMQNASKLITLNPMVWRNYWSAHQRFFRELAICAKVGPVVKTAKKHLEDGCAIVIGLQSTGEASTQVAMEEQVDQLDSNRTKTEFSDISLPRLLSSSRSVLTNFVKVHFPVQDQPAIPPKVPPLTADSSDAAKVYVAHLQKEADRINNLPPPRPIPELVAAQQNMIRLAKRLTLPPNPLDNLIDQLGGIDQVAELTGRSGRIVRHGEQFQYVKRIQESSNRKTLGLSMPKSAEDFDKLNIVEKKRFMDGRKSVAIISDAASTGISLHAAAGCGSSHKRRVHLTIELPWAADKAIQQLGRSHRSGQTSAPIYKMIVTDLGGERRFGAAVAKRMANLGALTKGDRRAASGSDMSEFDIDSTYGRRAVDRLFAALAPTVTSGISVPSSNCNLILEAYTRENGGLDAVTMPEVQLRMHALGIAQKALIDVGLIGEDSKKKSSVKLFLNRIAGIPVEPQKLVFSLFMATLNDIVKQAKATGAFEGSVQDVRATHIEMDGTPEKLAIDRRSGAETKLVRLVLDRGVSLETIADQSIKDAVADGSHDEGKVAKSGFYLSKRVIAGRNLILYAKRKIEPNPETGAYVPDPLKSMVVTRPNTGKNQCEMSTGDLNFKYRLLVSSDAISKLLLEQTEGDDGPDPVETIRQHHPMVSNEWNRAYDDSFCFDLNLGLAPRRSRLGLVVGAVLHIMPVLEGAVIMETQKDRALAVARVEVSNSGERIVGIRFPLNLRVLKHLKASLAEKLKGDMQQSVDFKDESFTAKDSKLAKWAESEPQTMKSFFTSNSKSTPSAKKRKADRSLPKVSPNAAVSAKVAKTNKKAASASITSFFGKKY